MAKQDEGGKGGREMASEGGGADLKLGTESPAKAGKSLPPSPSTPTTSSEMAKAGGFRMAEVSMLLLLLVEEDIWERKRRDVTRRKQVGGGNSKWHITHAWIKQSESHACTNTSGMGHERERERRQLPRREAKKGVDAWSKFMSLTDRMRVGVSREGEEEALQRLPEEMTRPVIIYCTYSQ